MERDLSLTAPPISSWSYSRLKNYETCPYQAYLRYGERRPEPATIDRTNAERGIAIHTEAESFIKDANAPLPKSIAKNAAVMEEVKAAFAEGRASVEEEWAFTVEWEPTGWMASNAWLRIKLDAYVKDEVVGTAFDWKSGRKFGNEIPHAQQGQLYMLGCFVRDPELEVVKTRFVYVDHGVEVQREYTRDQVPKLLAYWTERGSKMTNALTFPAKPNKINCRYCPYSPNNGGDRSCPWGVELG